MLSKIAKFFRAPIVTCRSCGRAIEISVVNYRGFLVELSNRRGQWRVRVTKPGAMVRYQDEQYNAWISTRDMQRDVALARAKALIDAGATA